MTSASLQSTVLVIGVGNEYRRDDGVGPYVARHLNEKIPTSIRVVQASGEGASLMDLWKNVSRVVLVDAVRTQKQPGKIHRLDARQQKIPSDYFNYSTHAFSVAEAVEMARVLNQLPACFIIYGIEGEDFGSGKELSPLVQQAAQQLIDQLIKELNHA